MLLFAFVYQPSLGTAISINLIAFRSLVECFLIGSDDASASSALSTWSSILVDSLVA